MKRIKRNYILCIVIIVIVVAAIAIALYPSKPSYCFDSDVGAVFACTDGSYRVVSNLAGAGYKIIKPDGTLIDCPMVASPSTECLSALDICSDVNLC